MYLLTLFIGTILSLINDKKRVSFSIFLLIIASLTFFRYGAGTDYFSYRFLFSRLNTNFLLEIARGIDSQEIGFRVLGSILKGIGLSYQNYLIVIGIVNLYFISKICKKYSKNPTLSLLIYYSFYFFVWTFSGIRQGLTISIGLFLLLKYIEKENTKSVLVASLILSLVHSSALILIPLYFLTRLNFTQKQITIFSLMSIAVSFIPIGNLLNYLTWIPLIGRASQNWTSSSGIINIFDFQTFGRIIFLMIALFFYNAYAKRDQVSRKIINMYILSIDFYFILKFSEVLAGRLSIYGKILDIIILANIVYLYKDKFSKLLYAFLLIVLCNSYMYKELNAIKMNAGLMDYESSKVIPYTNIWNKDEYFFNNKLHFDID